MLQLSVRMQRWPHFVKKFDFSSSKFVQEEKVEHQAVVALKEAAEEEINKEVVEEEVEELLQHQLLKEIAPRILVTATFMASGNITL